MLNEVEKGDIRQHLMKVIASSEFARSDRASAMLRFIVLRALECDGESLKERAIGTDVFDREPDWDPKLDTVVRTEARRVRKKLQEYYSSPASEGQTVRIDVPVGGYSPVFTFQRSQTSGTGCQDDLLESDLGSRSVLHHDTDVSFHSAAPQLSVYRVRHHNWYRWAFSLLTFCVIGLAIFGIRAHRPSVDRADRFQTIPITSGYGQTMHPSISPDATQVAYAWDRGDGQTRIYLQLLSGGVPWRLTSSNSIELDPAWSPRGEKLAFLRLSGTTLDVIVRDISSGKESVIGTIASQLGDWTGAPGPLLGELGPAWLPDEDAVIVSDSFPQSAKTGLVEIRLADGSRKQLTSTQGSVEDFIPRICPDGRTVAFVRAVSHGISDLHVLDLRTGELKQITRDASSVNGIYWSKDCKSIVFSSNRRGPYQLWKVLLADASMEKIDTDSANAIDPQIVGNPAWIAFVTRNENWNVKRFDLKKVSEVPSREPFIASAGRNHSAHFSPDGRHIAFVSDRSGAWEIWLCDQTCSDPKMLTNFRGSWLGGVSWSPDSSQLAFDARLGRNSAIYHMAIASQSPQPYEVNSFEERMPTWSGDGKWIYFNSDRDGTVSIWKRGTADGIVQKVGMGFVARDAGNGAGLLIGHADGSLWLLQDANRGQVRLQENVIANPVLAWTVHDGDVYYSTGIDRASIQVFNLSGLRSSTLITLSGMVPQTSASLDISPDGRYLLATLVYRSDGNIYRRDGPF